MTAFVLRECIVGISACIGCWLAYWIEMLEHYIDFMLASLLGVIKPSISATLLAARL